MLYLVIYADANVDVKHLKVIVAWVQSPEADRGSEGSAVLQRFLNSVVQVKPAIKGVSPRKIHGWKVHKAQNGRTNQIRILHTATHDSSAVRSWRV